MRVLIAAAVLLLPLVAQADDPSFTTAATAAAVAPVLISDTSWNSPHGRAWHVNTAVAGGPRDDRYVEFSNTQDKDIAEIRLHVSYCGVKGSKHDAGWMKLKGPFAARGSFKAVPSSPSGGSISQSLESFEGESVSHHLLITEVVIVDGDGSTFQYSSDLAKVLSENISNFCANF
jgi:hypothetical protein